MEQGQLDIVWLPVSWWEGWEDNGNVIRYPVPVLSLPGGPVVGTTKTAETLLRFHVANPKASGSSPQKESLNVGLVVFQSQRIGALQKIVMSVKIFPGGGGGSYFGFPNQKMRQCPHCAGNPSQKLSGEIATAPAP